ncbi:MAG: tocopherol cyclase family protein [Promethearchaeota archaeon]
MRRIWKPEMPQVKFGKAHHFEGWYYKMVDSAEQNALALIPGVSFGANRNDSHTFVQVLDGRNALSHYYKFPIDEFSSSSKDFDITIERNKFALEGIVLSLEDDGRSVQGELSFGDPIPWPVRRLSPGAMGPFRFMPRMQCLHGILSFDHEVQGSLTIDGREIDFSNGRGYIEKDWGREFPSAWIWMQSNHFDEKGVSFTASIASIPFARGTFTGLLAGLLFNGQIHRFTTYTRAKLSTPEVSDDRVVFKIKSNRHLIEVDAERSHGASLRSPVGGLMIGRILESLDGSIHLRLYDLRNRTKDLLFEGIGRNAGLEVVGNLEELGAIKA